MKKILLPVMLVCNAQAFAQTQMSSSGNQSMSMTTGNSIAITFTGSNSSSGSVVSLPFSTTSDYANGKTSSDQQIQVMSNRTFNVVVKAASSNFTYSGSVTPVPVMPVSGILKVMVPSNTTGGAVAAPFSSSGFTSLSGTNQNLITNGAIGTDQLFSIRYQATPGFAYPAGIYTVDVVFTATQQ